MEEGLREKQRRQRTDAILNAARELAQEIGYEAVTMDALAARANMSKPTLYAYFPNKEAIAVASVVRSIQCGLVKLETCSSTHTPLQSLEGYFRWVLVGKYQERSLGFGSPNKEAVRTNPEYQTCFQEMMARLTALMEAGKASGEIDPALDTRTAIQTFVSIARDSEYHELIASNAITAEAMIETLTTLLIRGLKRES
ncbi:MAG: helix-turn-helix domain-containing protein [Armatimonas sp.]